MRTMTVESIVKSRTELGLICLCFIVLASMPAGCRSTPKAIENMPTNAAVVAEPSKPVTFTDKPELQVGTGPMDADAPVEFLKTDSGLKYRILRKSEGPKPTAASTVTVKYRGWLNNGKVFDSSYERGQPTTFPLSGVVAGWTEGMQLIGLGGMIELWVPSNLGYGERGSPGTIPAHATLHFIVEIMEVK